MLQELIDSSSETTRLVNNLPIEEEHYALQQQAYISSNGCIKPDILMGKDGKTDNSTTISNSNNFTKIKNIKRDESNARLHPYQLNAKELINNNNVTLNENIITTTTCSSLVYSNKEKINQSLKKIKV